MDRAIFKAARAAITKSTPDLNPHPPNTTTPGLALHHVAGFSSSAGTTNLYFGQSDSEVIYPAAALGIVNNIAHNNTQTFFNAHTDDCCSLSYNRDHDLAASGQVGSIPVVHVWKAHSSTPSIQSLAALPLGKGYLGVAAISISWDGKYVLAAARDSDHTLFVWDWAAKSKLVVQATSGKTTITGLAFSAVTTSDSTVYQFMSIGEKTARVWGFDSKARTLTSKNGVFGGKVEQQTLTSLTYLVRENVYVTGTITGDVLIWSPSAKETKLVTCHKDVHDGGVFGLSALPSGGFVSGGANATIRTFGPDALTPHHEKGTVVRDTGCIASVDALGHKLIVGFNDGSFGTWCLNHKRLYLCMQGHVCDQKLEVWGLCAFDRVITCGDDKRLIVWTAPPKFGVLQQTKLARPGRCVGYNAASNTVAVGLSSGQVAFYNMADLGLIREMDVSKTKKAVSVVKYSPTQKNVLAVGTHDSSIYILVGDTITSVITAHTAFVTTLDWSVDGTVIQSNSGDYELLFTRVSGDGIGTQEPNASSVRDVTWSTYTCTIGWATVGMWEGQGMDGTDINACDSYLSVKDESRRLLVLGNDLSKVEMMRFPARGTGRKSYSAHSAHVTNVRFSPDGKWVYSTGGKDGCVMVWAVVAD